MEPLVTPLTEADWTAHAESVRRLAHALVFDADRADDVAQEALTIALERGPRAGGSLRAWLAGVVRNVARNVVRGDRHRRERERAAARPEAVPSPAEWTERLAEQRRVIDVVLALEEPYRTVVILRYFEDLSPPEIAGRLAVPLETVRTRLRRARERLRAKLDDAHRGDRGRWVHALLPLGWAHRPEGSGWAPWVVGGLAVKKIVVVLGVVALLATGAWLSTQLGDGTGRRDSDVPTPDMAGRGDATPSVGPTLSGQPAPGAPAPTAPAPVDFAALDRDRDLHGIVVSTSKVPVAGARVLAVTRTWRLTKPGRPATGAEEQILAQTTSSSDGSFALRLERGASVYLRAEAVGFGTRESTFACAGARVRIVLGPPVRLVVSVRDEQARPVAEATVRYFQGGSFMSGAARTPYAFSREGSSDATGLCLFDALPASVWGFLDVTHASMGSPGWRRVTLSAPGEHREVVVLLAGRSLRGRVTDKATGKPIADAFVGADWFQSRAVRTDAEGAFDFRGWTSEGPGELYASADEYVLLGIEVSGKDTIDFALLRGRALRGKVLDGRGQPVADAAVRAGTSEDPNGATTGGAVTAADGSYEFRGLRPDASYRLVATKEGHGAASVEVQQPEDPSAAIEAPDLVLAAAYRVEGRVLDTLGQPVEGLEVLVTGHRERRVTDDLGRFRLTDVAPGTYGFSIRGQGRISISRSVAVLEADVLDVELVVAAGRPLDVVVEAEGAPTPPLGLSVDVVDAEGALRRGHPDEKGHLTFLVPEGQARVRISAWPEGWLPPDERSVRAGDAEVRMTLRRAEAIAGVVRRTDGRPLAQAHLLVRVPGRSERLAVTDAAGAFRLHVEPGSTVGIAFTGILGRAQEPWAEAERAPLYGAVAGVASGSKGVVIEVREFATDQTLLVRVLGPDGTPVPGATVLYEGRSARTDADGRVKLEALPGRPIDLVAMAGVDPARGIGWLAARAAQIVPAGQELTLQYRIGVRIAGRVIGATGPRAGAAIELRYQSRGIAWGLSGPDGGFTLIIDSEQALPLTIRATVPGESLTEIHLDLDRLPAEPVELRVPRR